MIGVPKKYTFIINRPVALFGGATPAFCLRRTGLTGGAGPVILEFTRRYAPEKRGGMDMDEITCCFTGHRPQSLPWRFDERDGRCLALQARLRDAIEDAIDQGARRFLTGMALGVDTWAAELVLSFRQRLPVELVCVIPCAGQQARWGAPARRRYQNILERADRRIVLEERYSPGCFERRNRYMVDHSDLVIAVWNGLPSGTGATVAYARAQGKLVRILPP